VTLSLINDNDGAWPRPLNDKIHEIHETPAFCSVIDAVDGAYFVSRERQITY
jgi:hypothetical protein